MKENAAIIIWRQSEIWAADIITISFINDINIAVFAGTAKGLVFGGKTYNTALPHVHIFNNPQLATPARALCVCVCVFRHYALY